MDVGVYEQRMALTRWWPLDPVCPECESCDTHLEAGTQCQVMEETGTTRAVTTLITGANKGIGFETARQLIMAVVNVGSSLGSLGRVTTEGLPESGIPAMAYGSSKAAVTMITVHYAKAFPKMRINCVDPGYTATDMNGNSGHRSAAAAADIIAHMACPGPDGPTGTYRDVHGPLPW
jgi:NAD(P)-dependent dehydrogenase (short-subunit alcohol dehydrogenase family)